MLGYFWFVTESPGFLRDILCKLKMFVKIFFFYCALPKNWTRHLISTVFTEEKSWRKSVRFNSDLPATEHNNVQILRLITSALILNNLPCRSTKKYYLLSTDHSKTTLPYNHPCDILTIHLLQQNTGTFYLHPNFLSNCKQGNYSTSKY